MHAIEMPSLGESIDEGKVLCWVKHVGEAVQKGDVLVEIETDKVNVEVASTAGGLLRAILVPEGASVTVGSIIALVGMADEALPDEALLPEPPIKVADRTNKRRQSSLAAISWRGGLSVFLLTLFVSQYRGSWISATIPGLLLISAGFLLGMTVQKWRNNARGSASDSESSAKLKTINRD